MADGAARGLLNYNMVMERSCITACYVNVAMWVSFSKGHPQGMPLRYNQID